MKKFVFLAPAGENGESNGGAADRGDALPDSLAAAEALGTQDQETEGEVDAGKGAQPEDTKKQDIRIPKARFDEAQRKARQKIEALENELAQHRKANQARSVDSQLAEFEEKIDDLESQREAALMDGDKDKAKALRTQINALRNKVDSYRTETVTEQARQRAVQELRYNNAYEQAISDFPELDDASPDFDSDKEGEVRELLQGFVSQGVAPDVALKRAVKYVMGTAGKKTVEKPADNRATKARQTAADANKRQPPSLNSVGKDSTDTGIDVSSLSFKDIGKMDQAQLRKLRGDDL